MKKTISQAALKARQAKKAKPEEVTPAPPTPEPTLPTQDTTQLAERTIEASMRMEHAFQQSMAISD